MQKIIYQKLKMQIALEIVVLGVLTTIFLCSFPQRSQTVDSCLALFALGLLALNIKFTKKVVWAQSPTKNKSPMLKQCMVKVMVATFALVFAFFVISIAMGYFQNGWQTAFKHIFNWHIVIAIGIYFPWALLQQTLFQFYLLGRLRVLFSSPYMAIICTGIFYGLVHLPDVGVTSVTVIAGIFWSKIYNDYRYLTPLALSHAILGSTFYYWIYGQDLVNSWLGKF